MNSRRLKHSMHSLHVRLEEYYSERRERKQDRMLLALPGQRFGVQAARVSHITAAITRRVTVQQLSVESWRGRAHAIAFTRHRREISHRHHEIVGILCPSDERNNTVVNIVKVDPLKAFPTKFYLMQRGLLNVKLVERPYVLLNFAVEVEFKKTPVELPIVVPLTPLTDLASHEEQFLAGMGIHVPVQGSQVCELLPIVAWHLTEHGAFAVHDLVVRERQNKVLS